MILLLLGLVVLELQVMATPVSINHVTVLLPQHIEGVGRPRVILKAEGGDSGGCFHWNVNVEDILVLKLETNKHCPAGSSNAAEISPIAMPPNSAKIDERSSARVSATDVKNQDAGVESEVFIDKIYRLDMLLTTHVVFVDFIEVLDLQAFDNKGNVFTSLMGLPFDWSLDHDNVLKPITFKEANVQVTQYYRDNEASGTDRLPVTGRHAGKANVTAVLRDPVRSISCKETLVVQEYLEIRPKRAYLARHTSITFTLFFKHRQYFMEGGEMKGSADTWVQKEMPSKQYKWSLKQPIGLVDPDMGVVQGERLGATVLVVTDANLPEHTEEAKVYVVDPHRVELRPRHASCHDKSYVAQGHTFELDIFLFDMRNNSIMISPQLEFHLAQQGEGSLELKEGRGQLKEGWVEGWVALQPLISGWGKEGGMLPPTLRLVAQKLGELKVSLRLGPLSLEAELVVVVTEPLTVREPTVVLPDPAFTGSQPVFHTEARGGSGKYVWSSAQPSVASVASLVTTGVGPGAMVTALSAGLTKVTVRDQCNAANQADSLVLVTAPAAPEFEPGPGDVQVGSTLELIVAARDTMGRQYSNCSTLLLDIAVDRATPGAALSFTESSTLQCLTECPGHPGRGCWLLTVQGNTAGFEQARVSLQQGKLFAVKPLAAFPPLLLASNHLVLVVGAAALLEFSLGPLPWPAGGFKGPEDMARPQSSPSSWTSAAAVRGPWSAGLAGPSLLRYREGVFTHQDSARVVAVRDKGERHAYTVTCLEATYTEPLALELLVGNTPTSQNPIPTVARAVVRVTCYPKWRLEPQQPMLGIRTLKQMELFAMDRLDTDYHVLPPHHQLVHSVRWEVANPDIASLSPAGLVTGRKLGQTQIIASLELPELALLGPEDKRRLGLSQAVNATVLFQAFQLQATTTHLLQGQNMVVTVVGINEEVPGDASFEHITVKWLEPPGGGLMLHPLLSLPATGAVDGFSVGVYARRPGDFRLTATIQVDAPVTGGEPAVFEQWLQVTVLEPLELLSPRVIVLPHGTVAAIVTSLDHSATALHYSVLHQGTGDPPVRVTNRGVVHVTSHERSNQGQGDADEDAVVLVSTPGCSAANLMSPPSHAVPSWHTQRSQTRQLQTVRVEVRAPAFLALRALGGPLAGPLCVGSNRTLELILQDRLGRPFDSLEGLTIDSSALKIELSHPAIAIKPLSEVSVPSKCSSALCPDSDGALMGRDVLSLLALTVTGPVQGVVFSVAKLWLSDMDLPPLFIRLDVAEQCERPSPVGFTLFFSATLRDKDKGAQREWVALLTRALVDTLQIAADRIAVGVVDPFSSLASAQIFIMPHLSAEVHPDQWHLTPASPDTDLLRTALENPAGALRRTMHLHSVSDISDTRNISGMITTIWFPPPDVPAAVKDISPDRVPDIEEGQIFYLFVVSACVTALLMLLKMCVMVGSSRPTPRARLEDPRGEVFYQPPVIDEY